MGQVNNMRVISLKEVILTVIDWGKYLCSKWVILIIAGFIGGVLGFFYIKSKKTEYTALTTFVLESGDQGGGLGQYAGMAAMVGIDLGGGGSGGIFQGDNLLELYKSRKMIEATLLLPSKSDTSLLLLDRYIAMNKYREQWQERKSKLLNINFKNVPQTMTRERDSLLQKFVQSINQKNLIVGKIDKKLSIIKVEVKSTDETFSKEFNDALVSEVNKFYVTTKTKKSLDNIEILQHKTDSVRQNLYGAISSAAVAIDNTPNLNPTKQAQRTVPAQRSQATAETNKAILGHLLQNLELSKMAMLKESPLIQIVDNPIYPLQTEKPSKIKGVLVGGFISGIIAILLLIIIRAYKKVMN